MVVDTSVLNYLHNAGLDDHAGTFLEKYDCTLLLVQSIYYRELVDPVRNGFVNDWKSQGLLELVDGPESGSPLGKDERKTYRKVRRKVKDSTTSLLDGQALHVAKSRGRPLITTDERLLDQAHQMGVYWYDFLDVVDALNEMGCLDTNTYDETLSNWPVSDQRTAEELKEESESRASEREFDCD